MKRKTFRELCNEAIIKANELLDNRGEEYNRGQINISDYFNSLDDPEQAVFVLIWIKILRLKSHLLNKKPSEEKKRIEDILDAINYLRFLYATINK